MKNIILFLIISINIVSLTAQQTDEIRFNFDNQFLRNPAALCSWNQTEVGLYYQNNFTAINNAPVTMFAGLQFAVPNQNVSVGLALHNESAGVINNTSINVTSSYKILDLFNSGDYLAGGIGLSFSNVGVNGDDIKATNTNDPLIASGFESAFGTNIGFGFYYSSLRVMDPRSRRSSFQFGLSGLKALPQNVNLNSLSYKEQLYFGGLAAAIIPISRDMSWRSQLELQYEGGKLFNGILSTEMRFVNLVQVGVSFDKFNTVGFLVGLTLNDLLAIDTELVFVVNGNMPLGELDNYVNPGIAFGLQYRFIGNKFSKF